MLTPLNSFQRKNRQRARTRLIAQLGVLTAILAVFFFSYRFGEQQMAARVSQRMDEVRALTGERDELHKQVIDLQAAALVDQQKINELTARYREQIPNDVVAGMVATLREKLAAGVSAARLNTILNAAGMPRTCRNKESKRFMLSTSLNQGTDSAATFASGTLTVSGEGLNATSPENKPEAWYDPQKKVTMKFRLIGGKVSVAEGLLPLQHSIIDDALEYRFTIEAGARGFVIVTADQCDYPYTPAAAPAPAPAAPAPTAAE